MNAVIKFEYLFAFSRQNVSIGSNKILQQNYILEMLKKIQIIMYKYNIIII